MKANSNIVLYTLALLLAGTTAYGQAKKKGTSKNNSKVEAWISNPDRSALLQKQTNSLSFTNTDNGTPVIDVDATKQFQSIDGFGFTLTGGSATHINQMPGAAQDALLKELFLTKGNGIGISYLRLSIAASDLSAEVFTYDDVAGDTALQHFSIDKEKVDLIPVLKKILKLSPGIKILGSPWTAPAWMKTNNSFIGGSLKPEYYHAYANYFVKYIHAMKAEGINIDAITIQNEPLHGGNNPSMVMQSAEQAAFVKEALGPVFKQAKLKTKIILYDHNCDKPEYPMNILADKDAYPYIDGSAFHLYGGRISAMSTVHDAYPEKHLYFTEQWSDGKGSFSRELTGNTTRLTIGAIRNWSRNVLQWNLTSNPALTPHTDKGGCGQCLGGVTIDGANITRNSSYYVLGHASKFVAPGSVRIASNEPEQLDNVAFRTQEGKKVLVVVNNHPAEQEFQIRENGKLVAVKLGSHAVGTYVW
ncbi:glycoside hydrolase family 30 beta sandwich domain-containing protein [Chitinophaga sp. sic0106]|uniref:glycoside hydrolase family 30 protein n=1 Tax=Chitinophaga sp. sic0106 TaxID=2854785 RepID=UPI001C464080|nr:glycoside hydrolase family 30 beta sandwich domain-containing protein [Chitinophaga sp. sic0106]MBV7529090.1 glucosylceramidase [Chitinophaga sp. sic0106]